MCSASVPQPQPASTTLSPARRRSLRHTWSILAVCASSSVARGSGNRRRCRPWCRRATVRRNRCRCRNGDECCRVSRTRYCGAGGAVRRAPCARASPPWRRRRRSGRPFPTDSHQIPLDRHAPLAVGIAKAHRRIGEDRHERAAVGERHTRHCGHRARAHERALLHSKLDRWVPQEGAQPRQQPAVDRVTGCKGLRIVRFDRRPAVGRGSTLRTGCQALVKGVHG